MKILLISPDFPKMLGGISYYTYYLSQALSRKDFKVYVLTSKDKRVINSVEDETKIISAIKKWRFIALPQILKEINKIGPDWILIQYEPHMYNSHYAMPIYVALLITILRLSGYELLTTLHEIAIRFEIKKPKYWIVGILELLIAYVLCAMSHKIVVSIERYKNMVGIFDKKIHKIPVGSNILPLDISEHEKKELRNKVAFPEEVIISSYGHDPRRNDLLLGVIKELKEKDFAAKFLIIGFPKSWIETIKIKAKAQKTEDKFYFSDPVDAKDTYRYLSISDIFIMLEYIDGKGRGGISIKSTSLAAAYAAGLPIIGNKGDLADNFFKHRENIFLIDTLNIEDIVTAIRVLNEDKELQERLRIGAKRTYQMELQWPVIGQRYIKALEA